MRFGPTEILDTHAEAFAAWYTRLVITAADSHWLDAALRALTGYGTSVIGCDAEVGVERHLAAEQSPDGRAAAAVLLFAFTKKKLATAVGNRVGQCVLTCPTAACYDGSTQASEKLPLGDYVRFFGDGWELQESKHLPPDAPRSSCWQIPVMDGEFIVERAAGAATGVAGGNIIIQASSQSHGLAAARRAAGALTALPGIITPFPGGVCRSGSKVGSRYKKLVASIHEGFCPTLRDKAPSQLINGANCAYEIVIDGINRETVTAAMRRAVEAAAGESVIAIGAGSYGGKLGKIRIGLHELFQ